MHDDALRIASHITHPVTVAAFALVFAASALVVALRMKKPRIAALLAAAIIILGLAPLAASIFLQSRGVYRVRIVVLGPDKSLIDDARVSSSLGGEPKKVEGGWEFDIPPQSRPADGKLKLFSSVKSAFLSGSSELVLDKDYFPSIEIQLNRDDSAVIRGVVIDQHRRSVAGARVSIPGYPDIATSDEMGNFSLPAHAADGQIVHLRAQKDRSIVDISVPASGSVELMLKRP